MNIFKSTIIVMSLTVVSKLIGFIREALIANAFGTGIESDAYFIALTIPQVIFASLGLAIGTSLIPVYSQTKIDSQIDRNNFINNVLNITFFLSVILVLVINSFLYKIVKIFAPGFNDIQLHLAVNLTRILLPFIIIQGAVAIAIAILQYYEYFIVTSSISMLYNLSIISYLLISSKVNIYGLAYSTLIGFLLQFLIQMPFLIKIGWRYRLYINLKDEKIKKILLMTSPVFIGMIATQSNILIDRMMASTLFEGSISALSYASKLNSIFIGVFISALPIVLFPQLSKLFAEKNLEKYRSVVTNNLTIMLSITTPIVILLFVLSKEIIILLFHHGKFGNFEVTITSSAFKFFSIGLIGYAIQELISRSFYALGDSKTPMKNGVITAMLNIFLNLILVRYMSHNGLAFATSLSMIIGSIFLTFRLSKRLEISFKKLFIDNKFLLYISSFQLILIIPLKSLIDNYGLSPFLKVAIISFVSLFTVIVSFLLFKRSFINDFVRTKLKKRLY